MALDAVFLSIAAIVAPTAPATTMAVKPIVYVQAGHQTPGEPGYRLQTGASGEQAFTARISRNVEIRLRRAGVDARHTPARVTPNPAPGAVFISIHYDTPNGHAAVGHAITGAGENYYHGEGTGTAANRPYPDSAPHRPATSVSKSVQSSSRKLAAILTRRYATVFTRRLGARSGGVTLQPINGNRRMMRFYGYYRTRAQARVLIECGAAGTDAIMLRRTDVIGKAISDSIITYLRSEGRL